MKATIKTKNPYTYPTYTVMIGKEIIQGFYDRKQAREMRDRINLNLNLATISTEKLWN